MKTVRFCKRTDADHLSCYYKPAEKPVWGDWIDNGTGVEYVRAEVAERLLAALKDIAEFHLWSDDHPDQYRMIRVAQAAIKQAEEG